MLNRQQIRGVTHPSMPADVFGRSPLHVGLVATLVGLALFVGVQILLGIHNAGVVREAIERGWLSGYLFASASWAGPLLAGAIGYLVFALTGSAIASGGHRILALLPAAAFVFTPLAFAPHNPQPLAIRSYVDPTPIVATAAAGIALGTRRPWWPWLHVLFAAFAAGTLWLTIDLIDLFTWSEPGYSVGDTLAYELENLWPIVAIALIGSAWQSLAWALRRLNERPLRLVIAVNVLNLLDAVMTALAVGSGHAYESNPVIEAIGLPAKLIVVGAMSWILYRRKPSVLIWPTVVLLWVAAYHVAGVFVNGWR